MAIPPGAFRFGDGGRIIDSLERVFELLVREADALEWPDRAGSAARIEDGGRRLGASSRHEICITTRYR
jgi:hypothetical protein